jgi:hypothetical protein
MPKELKDVNLDTILDKNDEEFIKLLESLTTIK